MIKREGNKYKVMNSDGTKTLGTHPTKEKALEQLRAIEASKARQEALHEYANGGIKRKKKKC